MKKYNKFTIIFFTIILISLYSIKTIQERNITSKNFNYLTEQTAKTIYIVQGNESSTSGDGTESNPYQSIAHAIKQANNGDTIVLLENIVYRQPAANVDFIIDKNITINGNSNTLSFRGSNLELLANVDFKNLTLNMIPDGAGTTKIYVSGNEVTFNNVSTLISQTQSSERPTLIGGSKSGSKSGSHTKINIINGSSETRFKEIIAGKENADSSIPVTININSEFSKVDNGINLGGSGNYKVTGVVNLTTNSKNIKNIKATNSSNNTITIKDSTIYNIELTNIKNLNLKNNAEITPTNFNGISGDLNLANGTALWINTPGQLELNNLKGTGELIISTDTNLLVKGNIIDSTNIKLNGFESELISNLNKIYVEVLGTINLNTSVSLYNENEFYLINKELNKYRLIENNGFDKTSIKKIEINQKPTKLSYIVGEKIKLNGLMLELTDKNNNTMLVDYTNLNDYNIAYIPTENLTINDKKITFQSGSIKESIAITVSDKSTIKLDSQKYKPIIEDKKTIIDKEIPAKSFITNSKDLPSNTFYTFEKNPDLKKEGKQSVVIIITYPDKSIVSLEANLIVEKNITEPSNKVEEQLKEEIKDETKEEVNMDNQQSPNISQKEEQEKVETNQEPSSDNKDVKERKKEKTSNINTIFLIAIILLPIIIVVIYLNKKRVSK